MHINESLGETFSKMTEVICIPNSKQEKYIHIYFYSLAGPNGFSDYQEQPQQIYEPLPDQEFNPPQYPDEKEIYNQYGPGQFFFVLI